MSESIQEWDLLTLTVNDIAVIVSSSDRDEVRYLLAVIGNRLDLPLAQYNDTDYAYAESRYSYHPFHSVHAGLRLGRLTKYSFTPEGNHLLEAEVFRSVNKPSNLGYKAIYHIKRGGRQWRSQGLSKTVKQLLKDTTAPGSRACFSMGRWRAIRIVPPVISICSFY